MWMYDGKKILEDIQKKFVGKIVIRSSALGEDSLDKSEAGKFQTILNINSSIKKDVKKGIDDVIKSYKIKGKMNESHQILIQKQTLNSKTSGVIFTKTPDNGSPYYIINYEDSKLTDSVTKGTVGNTIKIYNKTSVKNLPKKWKKLIFAIKEIERISNHDKLDIEFAITNNSIVIYQVRPLTTIKKEITHKISVKIENEIKANQKKILLHKKKLHDQSKIAFSNMTDWNPAEIIGSNPSILDYSIYNYLIMKDSWSKGRELLGYNNPKNGFQGDHM